MSLMIEQRIRSVGEQGYTPCEKVPYRKENLKDGFVIHSERAKTPARFKWGQVEEMLSFVALHGSVRL
jgi:hypothetical protein